jgi:hypothetical protein
VPVGYEFLNLTNLSQFIQHELMYIVSHSSEDTCWWGSLGHKSALDTIICMYANFIFKVYVKSMQLRDDFHNKETLKAS